MKEKRLHTDTMMLQIREILNWLPSSSIRNIINEGLNDILNNGKIKSHCEMLLKSTDSAILSDTMKERNYIR